ncbi:unnamed protein product, partial [Porites evermanni]
DFFLNSDAQSVTWNEPPPVTTVSDYNFVHTSKIQLYEGSTNRKLNWRYSLTQGLFLVSIELEDASVVANVRQPSGSVTVSQAFTSTVNVTWVPGHVTLIIFNVTVSDERTFTCRLTVPGNSWRSNIIVDVVAPPRFTNVSNDQSLREGSDLQLFCDAYGRPTPNITWVRITSSGSESDVLHRGTIWDLKNISRTEAGTYRCIAYNGVGNPVNHTLRVYVEFPPNITLQNKYYVGREKSVSLDCKVDGYPIPTITWTPCNTQENVCDVSIVNQQDWHFFYGYEEILSAMKGQTDLNLMSILIGAKVINLTLTIINKECNEDDQSFWQSLKKAIVPLFPGNDDLEVGYIDLSVDKGSVRDHMGILLNKHKRKIRAEEKASGIVPDEPSELENLLDTIIALEESSEAESQELREGKNEKFENDRAKAEGARLKAMEKLSETRKRSSESEEEKTKRQRRSGSDAMEFLTD